VKPPPPHVVEKIEDILGRAEREWRKEETEECHHEGNDRQ
jgi:hypothetical protein